MKTRVIIPVYNHEHAIVHVISRIKEYGIPCLLGVCRSFNDPILIEIE